MAEFKSDNGNVGENVSKFLMDTIFFGQSAQATLYLEYKGALDFTYLYKSFYPISSQTGLKHISVQVKSGKTYASEDANMDFTFKRLKKSNKITWSTTSQPVLLIWVAPLDSHEVYWKFWDKRISNPVVINPNHKLNPSARFEIDRLITLNSIQRFNKSQYTLNSIFDKAEAVEFGKRKYKELPKAIDTNFGQIKLTNSAIRHLTRFGRKKEHVIGSMILLQYLEHFLLNSPNKIITDKGNLSKTKKGTIIHCRKVLFLYRGMHFKGSTDKTLFIRFNERIEYPKNWKKTGLLDQSIKHELTFESIFKKK